MSELFDDANTLGFYWKPNIFEDHFRTINSRSSNLHAPNISQGFWPTNTLCLCRGLVNRWPLIKFHDLSGDQALLMRYLWWYQLMIRRNWAGKIPIFAAGRNSGARQYWKEVINNTINDSNEVTRIHSYSHQTFTSIQEVTQWKTTSNCICPAPNRRSLPVGS